MNDHNRYRDSHAMPPSIIQYSKSSPMADSILTNATRCDRCKKPSMNRTMVGTDKEWLCARCLAELPVPMPPTVTGTVHQLKCWPDSFQAMVDGLKTFEIRRNDDRNYQVGDILDNREWEPIRNEYTGRALRQLVTFILGGGLYGVPEAYCIMSVRPAPSIVTGP